MESLATKWKIAKDEGLADSLITITVCYAFPLAVNNLNIPQDPTFSSALYVFRGNFIILFRILARIFSTFN
ncbi:hypothetical protein SDC9_82207 [bioreactor metagenome]|uniref:Uncharacterized protein n=1 Tax=bioreactor metagenome TaxID=1076179 RepID=A0A644ZCK3_9ZZZZ